MEKSQISVFKFSQAKTLAKTLANKTAQDIVEFVANNKGCSASHIAKELNLAPSTVHYNIKALVKAGILDNSTYHYSSKGKEVIHYTLANKAIIILPEEKESLFSQLKAFLPGILGVGFALASVGIYRLFSSFRVATSTKDSLMQASLPRQGFSQESINNAVHTNTNTLIQTTQDSSQQVLAHASQTTTLITQDILIGVCVGVGIMLLGGIGYFLIKKRRTIRK